MKYNLYLLAGITLLTILLLIMFSGMVSETETKIFEVNGSDSSEYGYTALLLGIGLPLILAILYVFARTRKGNPVEK